MLHIVAHSQEVDTGARNIKIILNRTLLPELAGSVCPVWRMGKVSPPYIGVSEEGPSATRSADPLWQGKRDLT